MYLVDSNIWLERLLMQERADEVGTFLEHTPPEVLFVTDFALFSIGIISTRLGEDRVFLRFLDDLINGGITVIHLLPEDLRQVVSVSREFNLDFDDSYQYVAAQKHNLTLVSFDRDFNRTDVERIYPSQAIP